MGVSSPQGGGAAALVEDRPGADAAAPRGGPGAGRSQAQDTDSESVVGHDTGLGWRVQT